MSPRAAPASRIEQFSSGRVLPLYGALLAGIHVLTGAAWFLDKHVTSLTTGDDAVCWPLAPGCELVRALLTPKLVGALVVAYMALGAGAALSFLERRARRGFVLHALASALGLGIYALDYRMRLNQTMMFVWGSGVLFCTPRPKAAMQALVALFYGWAGTLKLGSEWLHGDALYARPLFVPPSLVPAACVYVLVLELVGVWGLFARDLRVRLFVYAQLLLFHLTSFTVVGWFYPLMMFALTAIFPLVWYFEPEAALTLASLRDPALRTTVLAILVAFSLCQLVPYRFPGDTAVTGEGRLFALHMFDARVVCQGGAVLTRSSGERSRALIINDHLDTRTRCDPIVLGATTQRLCRLLEAKDPHDVPRVDVAIDARRTGEPALRPLIHVEDACHADLTYSVVHHNAWITP